MGEPADAIRAEIEANGPITFARYMELALYGPGGYYEAPPVGTGGDFVTSPHVHPVFAELLATALAEMGTASGSASPLRLIEVGAGDGTLARDLLPALTETVGAVDYLAVERSPGARAALAASELAATDELPDDTAGVILANELLDNLPFRVLRDGAEVRVGLDRGRLVEVDVAPDDDLAPWAARPDGIVPIGALAFVEALAQRLTRHPAYALLIDYGSDGGAGGPMHGYAGHRIVEDVLAVPGATDVTAGVDMALMADTAVGAGAQAFPSVSQRAALTALGFEGWFRGELEVQQRHLDARDGLAAVRTWSGRGRAAMLVDPAGLGRFRWLVLASPGLPAPGWLVRASDEGLS